MMENKSIKMIINDHFDEYFDEVIRGRTQVLQDIFNEIEIREGFDLDEEYEDILTLLKGMMWVEYGVKITAKKLNKLIYVLERV